MKKDSKLFYARLYKIPQTYKKAVNTEVAQLTKIGLLARITETERGCA